MAVLVSIDSAVFLCNIVDIICRLQVIQTMCMDGFLIPTPEQQDAFGILGNNQLYSFVLGFSHFVVDRNYKLSCYIIYICTYCKTRNVRGY